MFMKSKPLVWARNQAIRFTKLESLGKAIVKMLGEPI